MDGERHDDDAMLRDVLADIRTDIREVVRESREARTTLYEGIETVARESRESNRLLQEEMGRIHTQVTELRTRLGMVSGIAGLFGGAVVVAVTKGLGVFFAKG